MICPKCGQQSDNFSTCSHCGIIFRKYAAQESLQRQLELERWERNQRQRDVLIKSSIAFAALALITVGFVLYDGDTDAGVETERSAPFVRETDAQRMARLTGEGYYDWESGKAEFVASTDHETFQKKRSRLVNLIVSKYTDEGPSGFLITRDCHAVIGSDMTRSGVQRGGDHNVDRQESEYRSHAAQLSNAQAAYESHRKSFMENCTDCSQAAFDAALASDTKKIDDIERELQEIDIKLQQSRATFEQSSKFTLRTATGKVTAKVVETNPQYNFSLVILDRTDCDALDIGDPDSLKLNDPVYAFSGLHSTRLNRGRFSGQTKMSPAVPALRHNIGLLPGDLGTPLLNAAGEVVGVTVSPTKGTPTAIPIDIALAMLKMPL